MPTAAHPHLVPHVSPAVAMPSANDPAADPAGFYAAAFRDYCDRLLDGAVTVRAADPGKVLFNSVGNMHFHLFTELFLQLSGCSHMTHPEGESVLFPGDFVLIPKGLPHYEICRRHKTPFHNLVVCFYGQTLSIHDAVETEKARPKILRHLHRNHPFTQKLQHYLDDMAELALQETEHTRNMLPGLARAFCEGVLHLIENEPEPPSARNHKVRVCQKLVMEHLSRMELCVKWLAVRLQCSADYLSHVFKEETGVSLIDYINVRRIEQARGLLEESNLNITEIAHACGYRDPAYFSRVFRQNANCSPRTYRKYA